MMGDRDNKYLSLKRILYAIQWPGIIISRFNFIRDIAYINMGIIRF